MKLARALACALVLAVVAACGTSPTASAPTPPAATPADAPPTSNSTYHGSGG